MCDPTRFSLLSEVTDTNGRSGGPHRGMLRADDQRRGAAHVAAIRARQQDAEVAPMSAVNPNRTLDSISGAQQFFESASCT